MVSAAAPAHPTRRDGSLRVPSKGLGNRALPGRTAPPGRGAYLGRLAALALLALLGWQEFRWITADTRWPGADDGALFLLSACQFHTWGQPVLEGAGPCLSATPYPPLATAPAALLFRLAGHASLDLARLATLPAFLLLLLALWLALANRGGTWTSLFAMALGALLWARSGLRGQVFSELAVAATGLACLGALAASNNLRRPGWSLLAGLLAALGLLSKWTWPLFFGAPLLVWLLRALVIGSQRRRALGGALLLLTGIGLAAPWYLTHRAAVLAFTATNLAGDYAGDPMGLGETWLFYPAAVLLRLSLPMAALAAAGSARACVERLRGLGGGPAADFSDAALLAFVTGLLLHMLLPYRVDRYLIPGLLCLVPVIARAWRGPGVPLVGLLGALFMLLRSGGGLPSQPPPGVPRAGNNRADVQAMVASLALPPLLPLLPPAAAMAPPWRGVAAVWLEEGATTLLLDDDGQTDPGGLLVALAERTWPPTAALLRGPAPPTPCDPAAQALLLQVQQRTTVPAGWLPLATWDGPHEQVWSVWRCR